MVAVATLVIVLFLSLIIVRIASEALILTGMPRQAAQFQARSAWTGTGFTTAEAEAVVNHPVRRRIMGVLMLLRGAGLVTAASTLMLSFVNVQDRGQGFLNFALLAGALVALWFFARSRYVDRLLARWINRALKRFTELGEAHDYEGLLHLAGDYAVMEVNAKPGGWITDATLDELRLPDEGVLALGVNHPDGTYLGAPHGSTRIQPGDTLLLYGRSTELTELSKRQAGETAKREQAVRVEQRVERHEEGLERERALEVREGDAPDQEGRQALAEDRAREREEVR